MLNAAPRFHYLAHCTITHYMLGIHEVKQQRKLLTVCQVAPMGKLGKACDAITRIAKQKSLPTSDGLSQVRVHVFSYSIHYCTGSGVMMGGLSLAGRPPESAFLKSSENVKMNAPPSRCAVSPREKGFPETSNQQLEVGGALS